MLKRPTQESLHEFILLEVLGVLRPVLLHGAFVMEASADKP